MDKITFHLKSQEFINELINDNPDIEIAIKNAIVEKCVKRISLKNWDYMNLEVAVRTIIDKEYFDPNNKTKISENTKAKIKEGITTQIDALIIDSIKDMFRDRIMPVINDKVKECTEEIKRFNIERMIKEEIEKQVKYKLGQLWK